MLIASHAFAGGAAGELIGSPIPAFFVGFILHFILDAIPHYDTTDGGKFTSRQWALVTVDFLIGAVLAVIFYHKIDQPISFFAGAIGGMLPDILDFTPIWYKQFRKTFFGKHMHRFHERIQAYGVGPWLGLSLQAAIVAVSILILMAKW